MKKRILLINPPYPFEEAPSPPLGLMSLGAYLIDNGFDVIIEDYVVNPYSKKKMKNILNSFKPDVIGASGVTMNINKSLNIINDFKKEDPDLVTVMGGPHVTFDADNILKLNHFVDFIVRGEGEITFTELLNSLDEKKDLKNIQGISFRNNGNIIHNDDRPFIGDINILPLPARHLISLSKYKALGFAINMVTSRGCPFKCIFCVGSRMVGRRVRYFDVNRVVDEFEILSKMGFKQINIVDDLFTSNKKKCIAICNEIINRGINHPWTAFARVDTISKELLLSLKEAGCIALCFGIESGNQEILDNVKKKINLQMCKDAADLCKEVGIEPLASYILGLPGETPETVEKTLQFAEFLNISYGFHILAPFPGSEVREKTEEYKMRIITNDWDLYDANQSVCESIFMPHKEIDEIYNDFNSRFNKSLFKFIELYDEGKSIPSEKIDMVKGFKEFEFVHDLLVDELVEKYSGNKADNNDILLFDFCKFLEVNSRYSFSDASKGLSRLIDLDCININNNNGAIEWMNS